MKGIVGIVTCLLLGAVYGEQNGTAVTYNTANSTKVEVVVKDGGGEARESRCYDCAFYMRGTKREGDERCHMADPEAPPSEADTVICQGSCVKEWMAENALTAYLYVGRYCADEENPCVEGTEERFGHTLVRTCCTGDLCNAATPTVRPLSALVVMAIAAAMLGLNTLL